MVAKRTTKSSNSTSNSNSNVTAEDARERAQQRALVPVAYKNWDVVWSRMHGFPWWPGVVFLDWQTPTEAELPIPKVLLEIPPPAERSVVVPGKSEPQTIVDHSVLVMFLDKGNWFVANANVQVVPFELGYNAYHKSTHKRAKAASALFKLAQQRAIRLLHVSPTPSEGDAALFALPPLTPLLKQPRLEATSHVKREPQSNSSRHAATPAFSGIDSNDTAVDFDMESASDSHASDEDFDIEHDADDVQWPTKRRSRSTTAAVTSEAQTTTIPVVAAAPTRVSHKPAAAATRTATAVAALLNDSVADTKTQANGTTRRKKLAAKATTTTTKQPPQPHNTGKQSHATLPVPANGTKAAAKAPKSHQQRVVDDDDKQQPVGLRLKKRRAPISSSSSSSDEEDDEEEEEDDEEEERDDEDDVELIEEPHDHDDAVEAAALTSSAATDMTTDHKPPVDGAAAYLSRTPLSTIWTTHVGDNDDEPVSEDSTVRSNSAASRTTKTLVYKQEFVWDDALFTSITNDNDSNNSGAVSADAAVVNDNASPVRERPLGKRVMRSVQQSQIRQSLMGGNLDPHTMVQCESYARDAALSSHSNSRSSRTATLVPPFDVVVHPDAAFVCDLHAHLATCEIIGFLGGRWDNETQTLFVQAAFPCRSLMIDGDDGSTDVEMDPGSEIELREIIQNAELEVVGWYHSHPAFAPDPSVRDIENQTSYQQLFQRPASPSDNKSSSSSSSTAAMLEPFVGLIVGTYDTKRDTPVSLFRYFHTRSERVSGGARREIFMPYELVPTQRQFKAVVNAERRNAIAKLMLYPSVARALFNQQTMPLQRVVVPHDERYSRSGGPAFAGIDVGGNGASAVKKSGASVTAPAGRKRRAPGGDAAAVVVRDAQQPTTGVKRRRGRPRVTADDGSSRIDLTSNDKKRETIAPTPTITTTTTTTADPASTTTAVDPNTAIVNDVDVPTPAPAATAGAAAAETLVDNEATDALLTQQRSTRSTAITTPATTTAPIATRRRTTRPTDTIVPSTCDHSSRCNDTTTIDATTIDATTDAIVIVDAPAPAEPLEPTPAPMEPVESVESAETATKDTPMDDTRTSATSSAQSSPLDPDDSSGHTPPDVISSRRRGRKPMQTQKKTQMKVSYASTGGDDALLSLRNPQHTAASTQSAVYGAFGSTTATSSVGVNGVATSEIKSELSTAAVVETTLTSSSQDSSASGRVTPTLSIPASRDSQLLFLIDEPPSVVVLDTMPKLETLSMTDAADDSNVIVLSPSRDAVTESQSQAPPVKIEVVPRAADAVVDDDDASDPVKREATAKADSTVLNEVRSLLNDMCEGVESFVSKRQHRDVDADVTTKQKEALAAAEVDLDTIRQAESLIQTETKTFGRAVESTHSTDVKIESVALSTGDSKEAFTSLLSIASPPTLSTPESMQASDAVASAAAVNRDTLDRIVASISSEQPTASTAVEAPTSDDVVMAPADDASVDEPHRMLQPPLVIPLSKPRMLFGSNRQVEDIQTSLASIAPIIAARRQQQQQQQSTDSVAPVAASATRAALAAAPSLNSNDDSKSKDVAAAKCTKSIRKSDDIVAQWNARLQSLRSAKYGAGVRGCTEQVITLVDYYRDFERRIDLHEPWKARVSKLRKIEASMRAYVQFVNISTHLRSDYVEDVVAYLELSWELSRPGR